MIHLTASWWGYRSVLCIVELTSTTSCKCCEIFTLWRTSLLFCFVFVLFFFKIQSKSESYVSDITPRWVGMWTMPLCERERVSADHHHTDPGDATLLEGLLRLIAPKWHFFSFFKIRPMCCANQPKQWSGFQHNAIVLHRSKIIGMLLKPSDFISHIHQVCDSHILVCSALIVCCYPPLLL